MDQDVVVPALFVFVGAAASTGLTGVSLRAAWRAGVRRRMAVTVALLSATVAFPLLALIGAGVLWTTAGAPVGVVILVVAGGWIGTWRRTRGRRRAPRPSA